MLTLVQRLREEVSFRPVSTDAELDKETDAIKLSFPIAGEKQGDLVIDKNFIKGEEHRRLVSNTSFPLKLRVLNRGEPIKRSSHFSLAEWDGRHLKLGIPEEYLTPAIEATLCPMLSTLISGNARYHKAEVDFRNALDLGVTREQASLLHKAKNNERRARRLFTAAEKLMETAARRKRLAENLEAVEANETNDFAKEQWHNLQRLIPAALQDLYLEGEGSNANEGKSLCALTQHFYVEGILLGPYKIKISLAQPSLIRIYAVEGAPLHPEGYPHPHVREGGSPCWGSLSTEVTSLAAEKNYFGLIVDAVRLLNQYQPNDHYKPITEWQAGTRLVREGSDSYCDGIPISLTELSQIRECLKCNKLREGSCPNGFNRDLLLSRCRSMSTPRDCVACTKEYHHNICSNKETAFQRCATCMATQGTAFCMLNCSYYKECQATLEDIVNLQELCKKANLPEDGSCPAREQCQNPCCTKEEQSE